MSPCFWMGELVTEGRYVDLIINKAIGPSIVEMA